MLATRGYPIGGCDVHIIQGSKIDEKEAVWIEGTRLKAGGASMLLDPSFKGYKRRPPHTEMASSLV
ncbi:hypothetical protein Tco_1288789, partial [Tanacetum coccineum]